MFIFPKDLVQCLAKPAANDLARPAGVRPGPQSRGARTWSLARHGDQLRGGARPGRAALHVGPPPVPELSDDTPTIRDNMSQPALPMRQEFP